VILIFKRSVMIIINKNKLFVFQPTNANIYIYHNGISLYNVHSYRFRHFYVTFKELNVCVSLVYIKFLKLNLLKLQFHKIIRLKVY